MPCSKRMARCSIKCLHKQDVESYRAARQADEERTERETALRRAELEQYLRENPMIDFKTWLIGKRT